MATNFVLPKHRATDINGTPIRGARLAFYRSGTNIPLATFANEALTVPNNNPVVADGDGWFGAIYLQPLPYRVALSDASGAQIWSVDDVRASVLSGTDITTRLRQIASSPLDYGALGNGEADEHKAVQEAIDAATSVVDLLGKTYRCNYGLTLRTGLTIRNGTLDFSACRDDFALSVTGHLQGKQLLAEDAKAGDSSLKLVDLSGVVPGDLILLSRGSGNAGGGELLRVAAVSGNSLRVAGRVRDTYSTADFSAVSRVEAATQVFVENVAVLGSRKSIGELRLIDAEFVDGLFVRDCAFNSFKSTGLNVSSSLNVTISSTSFRHGSAKASAINVGGASEHVVVGMGCTFCDIGIGVRIGAEQADGHISRDLSITGSSFTGCSRIAVYAGKEAQYVTIAGCQFEAPAQAECIHIDAADGVTVFGSVFCGPGNGIMRFNSPTNFSQFGNYFGVSGNPTIGFEAAMTVSGFPGRTAFSATGGTSSGRGCEICGGPPDGDALTAKGSGKGCGVRGSAPGEGIGVAGESASGHGVSGSSITGVAGSFASISNYALVATGDMADKPRKAALRLMPQSAIPSMLEDGAICIVGSTIYVRLNGVTRAVNVT